MQARAPRSKTFSSSHLLNIMHRLHTTYHSSQRKTNMGTCYIVFLLLLSTVSAEFDGFRILNKLYSQCDTSTDVLKCLKLQTLKVIERALRMDSFNIINGVSIVRDAEARSMSDSNETIVEDKLHNLETNQIDGMLAEKTNKFLTTHKVGICSKIII